MSGRVHVLLTRALKQDVRCSALVFFGLHILLCGVLLLAAWNTPVAALGRGMGEPWSRMSMAGIFAAGTEAAAATGAVRIAIYTQDMPNSDPVIVAVTRVLNVRNTTMITPIGTFKAGKGIWQAENLTTTLTGAIASTMNKTSNILFAKINVISVQTRGRTPTDAHQSGVLRPLVPS
jgi:hypothetical protein